jgi:hypothetical protein
MPLVEPVTSDAFPLRGCVVEVLGFVMVCVTVITPWQSRSERERNALLVKDVERLAEVVHAATGE